MQPFVMLSMAILVNWFLPEMFFYCVFFYLFVLCVAFFFKMTFSVMLLSSKPQIKTENFLGKMLFQHFFGGIWYSLVSK